MTAKFIIKLATNSYAGIFRYDNTKGNNIFNIEKQMFKKPYIFNSIH